MKCPKCNAPRPTGAVECPKCGVIYAKVKSNPARKKLKTCKACDKMISKNAKECPHCGEPTRIVTKIQIKKRSVSILLGVGILFFPVIFAWFTLRKGHSAMSRFMAFGWLLFSFFAGLMGGIIAPTYNDYKDRANMINDSQTTPNQESNSPPIHLVSWVCGEEYGYSTIKGEVKNESIKSIENLMVVGSFYTASGEFVSSQESLIDYNPILPGQVSPFDTMVTNNPQITNCKITFKTMFGGTVRYSSGE